MDSQSKEIIQLVVSQGRIQDSPSKPEAIKHHCEICSVQYACDGDEWHHAQMRCRVHRCEPCKQKEHGKKLYNAAKVPDKYQGIVSDKKALLDSAVNDAHGFYLWGGVGTGKTTIMTSAIKRITTEKFQECAYFSTPSLIMKLQDMYRKEKESPYEFLQILAEKPNLFLDDLGAEKLTDFSKQSIYFLLNEREQWGKRTFITSNYSLDYLDKLFDARISSRIAGMCKVVELTGPDRRLTTKRVS